MADFVPGLDLSEAFYLEVVRPAWDVAFSGVPHSAAQLGTGSDVLGYDTARSTDHGWGARVLIFVATRAASSSAQDFPTSFEATPSARCAC
jgi:hypothetical protein